MLNEKFEDLYEDDELEELSDEELDELYRPKKSNSRKSLAPLFVYKILKEETNRDRHVTQKEIAARLAEYPYEITIERKALARVIHNLEDTGFGITSKPKAGYWYDESKIWA